MIQQFLGPYRPQAHALLRIVAGLLFFLHGLPKLFGGFGRPAPVEPFKGVTPRAD